MITRRTFLERSALAAGGFSLTQSHGQATGEAITISTPLGTLAGEVKGNVHVLRGVPFAQPPIGPLRFRPPENVRPWFGTRSATRFAAAAPQAEASSGGNSEDCLYLNIWAPACKGRYPVFLWVHGGGFTGGRTSDPMADGTHFTDKGIVVVTVAYRLGVLGFLEVEPLLGSSYAGSANHGLQDIVAALTWCRNNIEAFGGDPDRLTIGGESAGAKLTDLLMGIPSAAPLFWQTISQSGGAERILPKERALTVSHGFQTAWEKENQTLVSTLSQAPVEQLILVQERFLKQWPMHFPLRPEVDSRFIAQAPLETIRQGSTRKKRLLLGTNRDESALFLGPNPVNPVVAADLGNVSLPEFRSVEEAYRTRFRSMPAPLRRIRSVSAEEYLIPSLRVADAHVAGGGTAFVYRFDYPGEGRFAHLAFHSYDLRFVWDHFTEASDRATTWANFILGKAPEADDLLAWPPYTLENRPTMILDAPSRVENNPDKDEIELWNGFQCGV